MNAIESYSVSKTVNMLINPKPPLLGVFGDLGGKKNTKPIN